MKKQKRECTADEKLFIDAHEERLNTLKVLQERIDRQSARYEKIKSTTNPKIPKKGN